MPKRQNKRSKREENPGWRDLVRELHRFEREADQGNVVYPPTPVLSLEVRPVPGEYWIFQPGWFNVRWWWDEIKASADLTRRALIKLQLYYIHQRTLLMVFSSECSTPATRSKKHMEHVEATLARLSEEVATRLFSLREKLSWLIYEISSSLFQLYLKPRQVGYGSVRRQVEALPDTGEYSDVLIILKEILRKLDSENMQALFSFRHGYVHNIRPLPDAEQPLLLLQIEKGLWDALRVGHLRARRIVHLAGEVWLKLVRATELLANTPLPSHGVEVSASITNTDLFDSMFGVHTGIGINTEDGKIIIDCMKECRGFKAWFLPERRIESSELTDEGKATLARVWEIVKKVVPPMEPEKEHGVIKHIIMNSSDEQRHLLLLTENAAADPLTESVVEEAGKRAREEMKESGKLFSLEEVQKMISQVRELQSWPKTAVDAFMDFIRGNASHPIPLAELEPEGPLLTYHVIFPTKSGGDIDVSGTPILSGQYSQFAMLHHEIIVRKNRTPSG